MREADLVVLDDGPVQIAELLPPRTRGRRDRTWREAVAREMPARAAPGFQLFSPQWCQWPPIQTPEHTSLPRLRLTYADLRG